MQEMTIEEKIQPQNRLRSIRAAANISQSDLSKFLKVATNTVTCYESGKTRIPASVFEALASIGVNPVFLMSGNGTMFEKSVLEIRKAIFGE